MYKRQIEDNPVDRCYRCKKLLFQKMKKKAQELGVPVIVEGTNADDLTVYRPGIRAIRELGITSPLALLGITKEEVRKFAGEYGISVSNRPSAPCLATRFPYGTRLNIDVYKRQAPSFSPVRGGADTDVSPCHTA